MRTLLHYFAGHPTAANLLMLGLLMLGIIAAPELKRRTFPDFETLQVEITVPYPGATAEDVEQAICTRVEDALDALSDVEEVTCDAREGLGTIVAEMQDGGNIDRFLADVNTEVDAIDDFPEETEEPVIKQKNRTDFVMSVAVTGPMSLSDLKSYSELLKDRIMASTEVTQVLIEGFSDRQLRIEIPAASLIQYNISAADIAATIARQSVDLPGGTLQTATGDVVIRFTDERRTIAELQELVVIAGNSGAEVRLGDIAHITDRFELDEEKVLFNGSRASILRINKTKQQDALDIVDQVEGFLAKERQLAPPTVSFTVTQNVSTIIRDRLTMLIENGIQGLLLVFLTMWLFFSFRYSFWISMGLPVSFMAALYGMYVAGMTINMITMVGLLLAIGLIMDDAIVIAENIATHMAKGKSAIDAVVDGTAEVSTGIFSSFTTTVCIFGSLAVFISGDIGKVLWAMPVVLILTLGISLIEAFLILPNHLSHALHAQSPQEQNRFRIWFDGKVDAVKEGTIKKLADAAIRWRYPFSGAVFGLLLVSVGMLAGGHVKLKPFPDLEGDVLEARVLLPQGTPLARTEAVAAHLTGALHTLNNEFTPSQPEGTQLVSNIGVYFNKNADANENGPHVVTVTADLLEGERRTVGNDAIIERWRTLTGAVPDVLSITWKEPILGPSGLPIDIRLRGDNLERLKSASHELTEWLRSFEGVADLHDDLRPGKPEIQATLKPGATAFGITAEEVARQLRAAFFGITATEFQHRNESYEVDVRFAPEDKNSLMDLSYFHVTGPAGEQIPLGEVVHVTWGRGWGRINRIDGLRTVTIQGDVDTRVANANQIISETKTHFLPALQKRYPEISFSLEGEAKEGAQTGASLRKAFLVGVFGVFLLLSLQFRSYAEPFTVLTAIPLAFIGVIWGHVLLGQPLTMPSLMGFVSLAGVVVNDSILLVEFLKIGLRKGLSISEAASFASRQRFRAVLLTSLTTIMGLLPLLFERSLQAQVLIPLAISIVFGLAMSTLLVLFVIPAFYTILNDHKLTEHARRKQ